MEQATRNEVVALTSDVFHLRAQCAGALALLREAEGHEADDGRMQIDYLLSGMLEQLKTVANRLSAVA